MPVFVKASRRAKAYYRGGNAKIKHYTREAMKGGTSNVSSRQYMMREMRLSSLRVQNERTITGKRKLMRKHISRKAFAREGIYA